MLESEKINELTDEAKSYLENRIALLKLEAAETVSDGFGEAVSFLIIGTVGAILFFLLSILAGISISIWLNDYLLGFGTVAGLYLLLFLLLILLRKKMIKLPFQNRMIQYIFKKEND